MADLHLTGNEIEIEQQNARAEARVKRLQKWSLGRSREYGMLKFSVAMTGLLLLILLIAISPFKVENRSGAPAYILLYFTFTFIFSLLISLKVKRELIKNGEISKLSRFLGLVLTISGFAGNIFVLIAGFYLLDRRKHLECQLAIFAFATNWLVFLVSLLNIFKEFVSNKFFLGMGVLLGLAVFLLLMIIISSTSFMDTKNRRHPLMLVLAIACILVVASGNIFAFILGLVILSKYRHPEAEVNPQWIDVVTRLYRNNMCLIGLLFISFLIMLSLISGLTFEPSIAEENNYRALFIEPCLEFPFGTDNYGRDIFTRIALGAQISLVVGFLSTLVPALIGGFLGAVAGYFGGRLDNGIMRVLDVLYAVPGMLLAIAVVAAFGSNTFNLVMALSLSGIPGYARIVRGSVLTVANNEFVEAAKACGTSNLRIITRHIIPNALAPVIVTMTMGIGAAVLSTSALSYLGLGVEPHVPEWGNILKIGSAYLEQHPYLAVIPGIAIILILLAFNFFGDGLRDALDPKMK